MNYIEFIIVNKNNLPPSPPIPTRIISDLLP